MNDSTASSTGTSTFSFSPALERELDEPLMAYDAEFFEWICARKAHDNPRGDFIKDTRAMVGWLKEDSSDADEVEFWIDRINLRMDQGCESAQRQFYRLARQYQRETGRTLKTLREAVAECWDGEARHAAR